MPVGMVVIVPPVTVGTACYFLPALSVLFPEILPRQRRTLRLQHRGRRHFRKNRVGLLPGQVSPGRMAGRPLPRLNRAAGPRTEHTVRRARIESERTQSHLYPLALRALEAQ